MQAFAEKQVGKREHFATSVGFHTSHDKRYPKKQNNASPKETARRINEQPNAKGHTQKDPQQSSKE